MIGKLDKLGKKDSEKTLTCINEIMKMYLQTKEEMSMLNDRFNRVNSDNLKLRQTLADRDA